MLHQFIAANRDAIIARTRRRPEGEQEHGVPLLLTQISETLRLEGSDAPFPADAIGSSATRHGGALLAAGLNVSQVVHDYGDVCQAITALAAEQHASITVAEFHTLNRSLDTAIAEAVTEHARLTAEARSAEEVEQLGQAAHELRDNLNTSILAFQALKEGGVGINGSTGSLLGRSLMRQRNLIDRTLSDARLTARKPHERLLVETLIDEIAATSMLHSEYRAVRFTVDPIDRDLVVFGDAQLLMSAVMNLVHNAFRHTPVGGRVVLRSHAERGSLVIEVEDEGGGIAGGEGVGMSIARRAVRAHGGHIHVRNMPNKGCVFVIEVPLAAGSPGVAN